MRLQSYEADGLALQPKSPPIRIVNILQIRRPPKTFSLYREDEMDDTMIVIYCLCEEVLEASTTGMTLKSGSPPPR
jgi:hypothetical protein